MFYSENKNGVLFYRSDNIKAPNAFSTRYGGLSKIPYLKEMNLAYSKGDDDKTVDENYRIFLSSSGLYNERAYAKQVHSNLVVYADRAGFYGEADGFYTDKKGITLVIKTADCLPILLCDPDNSVIGALHAGWKGSIGGIAKECVLKMVSIGAKTENIRTAIGPSIHPCCFEVKEDFIEEISKRIDNPLDYIEKRDGKYYADLQKMNIDILVSTGIKRENIDVSEKCTACDIKTFYSHRKMGEKRGTMCSCIALSK